ncbi:HAD family hydrolase, partial [Bordetella pertussis]
PVSRALAQADHALDAPLDEVNGFAALPGRGVQGEIGGERFQLGNRRLMRELGVSTPDIEARIDAYEAAGKTAIALADGQRVLLLAAVADTLKASSAAAVADLHRLGVRTLMLTGDNTRAAQAVA